MKQKLYILGMLNAVIIFTGTIFKMNHWAGAGIILTVGIMMMSLLFLPLALADNYKARGNRRNLVLLLVTWLTCFIVFTGALFKIQHWSYAGVFLMIAIPFPYVVFLPVFLAVTAKDKSISIYNTVYVLLLLVINSVFATMLALNVSKYRISDSYTLSRNYIYETRAIERFQMNIKTSDIQVKIDEALASVEQYREILLGKDGTTPDRWIKDPEVLVRPDSRQASAEGLFFDGSPTGTKLEEQLKKVVDVLAGTPGLEKLAAIAPDLLNTRESEGRNPNWAMRNFLDNTLSWSLIYLDDLSAKLKWLKLASHLVKDMAGNEGKNDTP